MSIDAKNLAQKQAAKHKSQIVTDADDDDGPTSDKHMFVIEDLGAPTAEDDLAGDFDDLSNRKHRLQLPGEKITHVLARIAERKSAGMVGRPRDMHKEMQRLSATC